MEIVEGINTLCENESKHNVFTILHSNEARYVNEDQKDQQGNKLMNFDDQFFYDAPVCSNEMAAIPVSKDRFQNSFSHGIEVVNDLPISKETDHEETIKRDKNNEDLIS
ncbi:hypothetical protein SUGI_0955780 [Cryptomeria japonica]|nr:hypothetical protein SUGI_0955780 [Cryptomeria japonica]